MTAELHDQLLLRARSAVAAERIVSADEVAQWPKGTLNALVRNGVLDEIEPGTSIQCTECFEGHVEVVDFVEEPSGSSLRPYIACPVAGRVAVDPRRLRRWRIASAGGGVEELAEAEPDLAGFLPEDSWPPIAQEFVAILRQAHRARSPVLRWRQIKERLKAKDYYPSRARDVKRYVPNWDDLIVSPKTGFYALRTASHQTSTK